MLTLHAPAAFKKQLGPLPAGVKIVSEGKTYNQVHWFVTGKAQVEKELKKIVALIKDNIICWIYYPKGTSKIQTDLTRDKGWDALLAHSDTLTWISLVSFDETWSAFGCRLKTVADKNKEAKPKERPILEYIDAATKTIRLPEDLALLLKKNKTATDFFNSLSIKNKKKKGFFQFKLSFTNRKEYVEWIVTAKQEARQEKQDAGSLQRLSKGWKNPQNL